MTTKPAYFPSIREKAAARWEQLDRDPELAGPWHQLFRQVQSPRHVLSELLQNADDASATEAVVRIEDGTFTFEHNGEDFSEDNFASLCRFGYSNKRALHTIGFRGIGFKSTFSLGDRVELLTPSLSISFDKTRFTEPQWTESPLRPDGKTCVRVIIRDQHRQRELEKNLEEWVKSPVSLLFFKHIRLLQVGGHVVHWRSLGPGPVPDSEGMALNENEADSLLLIRSDPEPFPDEALQEIRQERMLASGDDMEFPPCKVEIVLGAKGRLFVVLPTGVETKLPFACNAPFIQDPARLKIKDPETSPTNRWLLNRAGKLAARAMLKWISRVESATEVRAPAYGLLPDVDREENSLEGVCGAIVELAFAEAIENNPVLLTESGEIVFSEQGVIVPGTVLDIWKPEQAIALLDDKGRQPLTRDIRATDRNKLVRWGLVDEIDKAKVIRVLQNKHLPKPDSWRQLLALWAYIAPEISQYAYTSTRNLLKIVPVQGQEVLYSASEVARLGEKKLLQSEADWQFLSELLLVLNPNWTRFLADQRRVADEQDGSADQAQVRAALDVLTKIGLEEASDVTKVVNRVADRFFTQEKIGLAQCVQLTQIAAKLGVKAGAGFRFVTKDRRLRQSDKDLVLFDSTGRLEPLIPEADREKQLLHQDYTAQFSSCSKEEWLKWIASGNAGLRTFIPLIETRSYVGRQGSLDAELRNRGCAEIIEGRYKNPYYIIRDWDFDATLWSFWQKAAGDDPSIWSAIAQQILLERPEFWSQKLSARVVESASNGNERTVPTNGLVPSWIIRLRNLPCLRDTRGFSRQPSEMLRRTAETESLIEVEPFIDRFYDHASVRPLLDLLGVRSAPTGPSRMLECLRTLSEAENPPVQEIEKWYRRLDQMMTTCSTDDFVIVKEAFRTEKLILLQDGGWGSAQTVFLSSDEDDAPGAAVVRSSVSDLTLWRKVGVADRPTADLAVNWLKSLPSGLPLGPDDIRRVRAFLARHPLRVWDECEHWLNLAGEWCPSQDLAYSISMRTLTPWSHLHKWVKQKTADFQRLPIEILTTHPFSNLPPLSVHVEDRFHRDPRLDQPPEKKAWIEALGKGLGRLDIEAQDERALIKDIGDRLTKTIWQTTQGLETTPYIGGNPAGTARQADVVWLDCVLYVDRALSKAKLAKLVPEELGKASNRTDIKAALDYGFERSAEDVTAYLEENFKLLAEVQDSPIDRHTDQDINTTQEPETGEVNQESIDSQVELETAEEFKDDGAEETQSEDYGPEVTEINSRPQGHRSTPKPPQPSVMDRFAAAEGFRKEGPDRYFHPNGGWIGRTSGDGFPWERRTASGEIQRYYWPKEHCLERAPLQLDAEVWGLIDLHPDKYSLVLSDFQGKAVEVTGERLHKMRERNELVLYPATYRLVLDQRQSSRTHGGSAA